MSHTLPKNISPFRFVIDTAQLSDHFDIWTLDFLPFQEILNNFRDEVSSYIKDKELYFPIPYRRLNNAIMALSPTLVHAFEIDKGRQYALAVGVPENPAQLPQPAHLKRIVMKWVRHWTDNTNVKQEISEDVWQDLVQDLFTKLQEIGVDWKWQQFKAVDALAQGLDYSVNYRAVPSLIASLLHGKKSTIDGIEVYWRKVQDGVSKKLSIVSQPLHTSYAYRFRINEKSGEGYFAYKINFELETQAGRTDPWLVISFHMQRYGDEQLSINDIKRKVAALVGANRARMDDFPFDSTLVRLQIDTSHQTWSDSLQELLNLIGVKKENQLKPASEILSAIDPSDHWKADATGNEYYLIHAEGYEYGEDEEGHKLNPGYSQSHLAALLDAVCPYLPMLNRVDNVVPDHIKTPSGRTKPRALLHYGDIVKLKSLQSDEMYQMINRALRGEDMQIVILYNNPDTFTALQMSLSDTFSVNNGFTIPKNVHICDQFVPDELHQSLNIKTTYRDAHEAKVKDWELFLTTNIPKHNNTFVLVERVTTKQMGWGIYGVIRHACAQTGISCQMIKTVTLIEEGEKKRFRKVGNDKHRANNAAREVVLRHPAALFGHPHELYKAAGISHELEIIAFYLERNHLNVLYPIAVKIAADGSVEAAFPQGDSTIYEWMPYHRAASQLGRFIADQWRFTQWDNEKKRRMLRKSINPLNMSYWQLVTFVRDVLSRIDKPTIALIEAANWRNYNMWAQLSNSNIYEKRNILDFNVDNQVVEQIYKRDNPQFQHLLGVVRLRSGHETPQYLTDTLREFTQLAGFVDNSVPDMPHYFSVGGQLATSKEQRDKSLEHASMFDGKGAGVAYRYRQLVEFVPFFVRDDYQSVEGKLKLCRVMHYLRISPAWEIGNITHPYPLHLARTLVKDQLAVLSFDN